MGDDDSWDGICVFLALCCDFLLRGTTSEFVCVDLRRVDGFLWMDGDTYADYSLRSNLRSLYCGNIHFHNYEGRNYLLYSRWDKMAGYLVYKRTTAKSTIIGA